jgi:hypothetical protein
MFICVDPASIEFSMSSFNAADGEITTSPAAILLMVFSSSFFIDGQSFFIKSSSLI